MLSSPASSSLWGANSKQIQCFCPGPASQLSAWVASESLGPDPTYPTWRTQFFEPCSFLEGEGTGNPLRTLAWKIPWVEEPGRLQSMGSLRVGHD